MNLSNLLASRETLVAQARLANLAFAYTSLKRLAAVVARGQLSGLVRLQDADERDERYWPALSALSGSQAVLDEHFGDEDIVALADAIASATPGDQLDVTFPIEHLERDYVAALETELRRAGVKLDDTEVPADQRRE